MAYGIFSTFADRAATFGHAGEGARLLSRARTARKEEDRLARLSMDHGSGWIALEWDLQSAQRDAYEADIAFWRRALFSAPTITAAKRCLREGGRGLDDALGQEAVHPDATPLPFGLERHGMMTWRLQDTLREDGRV